MFTVNSLGLKAASTGGGGLRMDTITMLDVVVGAAGVNTRTEATPAVARSLPGTAARSWPAPKNEVWRSAPFQRMTEFDVKLAPFTISVAGPVRA